MTEGNQYSGYSARLDTKHAKVVKLIDARDSEPSFGCSKQHKSSNELTKDMNYGERGPSNSKDDQPILTNKQTRQTKSKNNNTQKLTGISKLSSSFV